MHGNINIIMEIYKGVGIFRVSRIFSISRFIMLKCKCNKKISISSGLHLIRLIKSKCLHKKFIISKIYDKI